MIAAKRISNEIPDAILLDLETPRMSGMRFLKKLMAQCPLPVIVFSSEQQAGSQVMNDALEMGAMDILVLPATGAREFLHQSAPMIQPKLKEVARQRHGGKETFSKTVQPKLSADVILPPRPRWSTVPKTERIICIGASTGGTDSLQVVLRPLPADSPGILIVQHMPDGFTDTFAKRLDSLCNIRVKEAAHGDAVLPGRALLAPGSHHLLLARRGDRYVVELNDGPLVTRHRPSVDVLFRSAARSAGNNAMGILLTGMGDDGARGLLEMREAGSPTIAEHESTCVVYGMPKEAIQRGAAEKIIPLHKIAQEIISPRR
ncbi:MAG: chemotaxis response regulator protein-glutamate methylesterase [Magnetococcales bacterium]|nr:chemotaxis response regulator protein-glutamate methylesterase [Magnetococcales bacterium]